MIPSARLIVTEPPSSPGAALVRVEMETIAGFAQDRLEEAFAALLVSARAARDEVPPLRAGLARPAALLSRLAEMASFSPDDGPAIRAFFTERFTAWRIVPEAGAPFFTGYFEPEVEGSETRGGRYQTPVLDRPPDLVTFAQGEVPPGLDGFSAARREADGVLSPYPDRAAIEAGALEGFNLERLWLADPVDLFFVQVQGSGRVRLPDGRVVRLVYAGRNGQPYTAIGRIVADRYGIPRAEMTMDRLRAFLAEDANRARAILRENRSYVFYRLAPDHDTALGPIGAENMPLTPGRSIAIDRTIWPYGLPVFVDVSIPMPNGSPTVWRRLTITQDTGSAILGPARADLFHGSGAEAGAVAGCTRHNGDFIVFWPKADP